MSRQLGRGKAHAKAILLGEHAVVYGHPAIAVPILSLQAWAEARFDPSLDDIIIELPHNGRAYSLQRDPQQPLVQAAALILQHLGATASNLRIRLRSQIPAASGLGSSAAVAAALIRAVSNLFDAKLRPATLSELVFQVEQVQHGTPSGIDNTVIAFERPVYFRKGQPPCFLPLPVLLHLVLADSGRPSLTRESVAAVREQREQDPAHVDAVLSCLGALAEEGRQALEQGDLVALGRCLSAAHELLAAIQVSNESLDRLVAAALEAGALGAKLTGGGRGGHVIALVEPESAEPVVEALRSAGAARATLCRIGRGCRVQ